MVNSSLTASPNLSLSHRVEEKHVGGISLLPTHIEKLGLVATLIIRTYICMPSCSFSSSFEAQCHSLRQYLNACMLYVVLF